MSIELHPSGEMRVKSALSEEMVFEKLEELEFDSFRKCMSVIVRERATSQIHLLSKVEKLIGHFLTFFRLTKSYCYSFLRP